MNEPHPKPQIDFSTVMSFIVILVGLGLCVGSAVYWAASGRFEEGIMTGGCTLAGAGALKEAGTRKLKSLPGYYRPEAPNPEEPK